MARTVLVIASLLVCPLLGQHAGHPRSDPYEVTLYVTVTDKRGAIVAGLPTDLFAVYEDGEERMPNSVDQDDSRVSVGILLDHSASMERHVAVRGGRVIRPLDALARTRDMLARLMGSLQVRASEFFLISFNDKPTLIHDFTADPKSILELVQSPSPEGLTALRDAVTLGLKTMEGASNERRVLILISDGGENESATKKRELEQAVRGSDVAIYSITASRSINNYRPRFSEAFLPHQLARRSGGTFLYANTIESFMAAADQIAYELRNRCAVRFSPRAGVDREWREVKVKIRWQDHRSELVDAGLKPPLSAHTRAGYYYKPAPTPAP